MKYYVANFNSGCDSELLQTSRELLSAAACDDGSLAAELSAAGAAAALCWLATHSSRHRPESVIVRA